MTSAPMSGWPGAATRPTHPTPPTGGRTGLLVGPGGDFAAIGAAADAAGFDAFYRRCRAVTEPLWPTLLQPLRTRSRGPRARAGRR